MFKVFTTKEFDERFGKLDESEKQIARKILSHLQEQGESVGKPLKVPYLREKKFEGKRLYFLSYENFMVILAVAISDKKAQQETIDKIISRIDYYKEIIESKFKD